MATSTAAVRRPSDRTADRTRVDITDLPTDEVRAYARFAGGVGDLHLERRGGRTYLVAEA